MQHNLYVCLLYWSETVKEISVLSESVEKWQEMAGIIGLLSKMFHGFTFTYIFHQKDPFEWTHILSPLLIAVFLEPSKAKVRIDNLAQLILLQDVRHCSLKCRQLLEKEMLRIVFPKHSFLFSPLLIFTPHQIPSFSSRLKKKLFHSLESLGISVLSSKKTYQKVAQETP